MIDYDEDYFTCFEFTKQKFNESTCNDRLPVRCCYCNQIFYRTKKILIDNIRLKQNKIYCNRICQQNARRQINEQKAAEKQLQTHICKHCHISFTGLPSKDASGDFCSLTCAKKYSSSFANTLQKRIQKSNTNCDRLHIERKPVINGKLVKTHRRVYDEFAKYRQKCQFRFKYDSDIGRHIQGYQLFEQFGVYSRLNKNGVARDHIVSVWYGFMNNISPKIIGHPANCRIIPMIDNIRKSSACSITLDQLIERIRL